MVYLFPADHSLEAWRISYCVAFEMRGIWEWIQQSKLGLLMKDCSAFGPRLQKGMRNNKTMDFLDLTPSKNPKPGVAEGVGWSKSYESNIRPKCSHCYDKTTNMSTWDVSVSRPNWDAGRRQTQICPNVTQGMGSDPRFEHDIVSARLTMSRPYRTGRCTQEASYIGWP